MEDNNLLVWNISIALANVACAPMVRAAQIRQVRKDKTSKGWRPLAGVLGDEEGMLAGWRGYLARGITFTVSDLYNNLFSDFNRFDHPWSILLFAPMTSLILSPLHAVQINRTVDVGVPMSSISPRERDDEELKGKKIVQKYDGYWDTFCQIYETKGVNGFYAGFAPNTVKLLLTDLHLAIFVVLTNAFEDDDMANVLLSFSYVLSRELVTYPLDLVANLQMLDFDNENLSFMDRINKMYKEEGVAAFYHGMVSYDNILATCAETPLTTLIAFVLTIIGGVSA